MKATAIQDKMGSVHIFRGHNIQLIQTGKYAYLRKNKYRTNTFDIAAGSEAEVFFQSEYHVNCFMESLTKKQLENINNGYSTNVNIDDLYFDNEQ